MFTNMYVQSVAVLETTIVCVFFSLDWLYSCNLYSNDSHRAVDISVRCTQDSQRSKPYCIMLFLMYIIDIFL